MRLPTNQSTDPLVLNQTIHALLQQGIVPLVAFDSLTPFSVDEKAWVSVPASCESQELLLKTLPKIPNKLMVEFESDPFECNLPDKLDNILLNFAVHLDDQTLYIQQSGYSPLSQIAQSLNTTAFASVTLGTCQSASCLKVLFNTFEIIFGTPNFIGLLMDTPQMLLNSKRPHWKRSLYKREDSSKTLIIIIVILVVVAVLILGGLVALVVLRHRARKRGPQEEVADATSSDKPQRKWPWKKQENVRQDTEEDKQLRDAVKQMMLNNNVPLGQKPEQKKVKQNAQRRLRLDAASATETFQARNALQEDGDQFSHFVNFTSSKFQTESSGGNKEDDSYLF